MSEYVVWTPRFDGDAPPNWKQGNLVDMRKRDWLKLWTSGYPAWDAAWDYRVPFEAIEAPAPAITPESFLAWARANPDKLPEGTVILESRDWAFDALENWLRYHESGGHEGDGSDAALGLVKKAFDNIKSRCRPIGNDITDEAIDAAWHKMLCAPDQEGKRKAFRDAISKASQ